MSERRGNVTIIQEESPQKCQLCGKIAETRPYGPLGEEICWECGLKDPVSRDKRMGQVLFGDKADTVQ